MEEPQPIKGMPRRREVAALYLLHQAGPLELGEAIGILADRLCLTRRTAHNIIKRLRRLGLARYTRDREGRIIVNASSPEDLVRAIALPYIRRRDEEGCTRRAPRPGG